MVATHVPSESLSDLESRSFAELVSGENELRPIDSLSRTFEIGQRLQFKFDECIHKADACDGIFEAHAHQMHVVLH